MTEAPPTRSSLVHPREFGYAEPMLNIKATDSAFSTYFGQNGYSKIILSHLGIRVFSLQNFLRCRPFLFSSHNLPSRFSERLIDWHYVFLVKGTPAKR